MAKLGAELTPEQLEHRRARGRARKWKRVADMTPEERERYKEISRRSRKKHCVSRRLRSRRYYSEHRDELRLKMRMRARMLPEAVKRKRAAINAAARALRGRTSETQNHRSTVVFDAAVRLMAWAEKQTEKETT